MSSREEILKAVRRQTVAPAELPALDGPWTTYDDPCGKFVSVLESIGGQCVFVDSESEIVATLSTQDSFANAKRIYSSVEAIEQANVDLTTLDDPHDLENVDYAILRGEFCVAENGAIWVTGDGVPQRVIYFATQHLALVVRANEIVSNMHEAYQRLEFQDTSFGTFLSGPSKTADIEQSLVIGAHGSRSLTVFLVQ